MADTGLFIGFGEPVRGREQKALQVFGESVAYYEGLKNSGKIESYDTALLEPHGGDLAGFFVLRGTKEQIAAVHGSEEFDRLTDRARLVVEHVGIVEARIGAGLTRGMALYQGLLAELA